MTEREADFHLLAHSSNICNNQDCSFKLGCGNMNHSSHPGGRNLPLLLSRICNAGNEELELEMKPGNFSVDMLILAARLMATLSFNH